MYICVSHLPKSYSAHIVLCTNDKLSVDVESTAGSATVNSEGKHNSASQGHCSWCVCLCVDTQGRCKQWCDLMLKVCIWGITHKRQKGKRNLKECHTLWTVAHHRVSPKTPALTPKPLTLMHKRHLIRKETYSSKGRKSLAVFIILGCQCSFMLIQLRCWTNLLMALHF